MNTDKHRYFVSCSWLRPSTPRIPNRSICVHLCSSGFYLCSKGLVPPHLPLHELRELPRQGRLEHQRVPADRVRERELRRVQEHALEALLAQRLVELEVAVFVVPQDRMLEVSQVHADLVRAPGEELRFEEREALAAREPPEHRLGRL